jgi:hypothetical protein
VCSYLQEHVFLLRGQLVEASLSPTILDLGGGETSFDVGVEPFFWNFVEFISAFSAAEKL